MAPILSTRMALVSAVMLSTAVMLWQSGPAILWFLLAEIPRIYGSLLSWLAPPYLYFVINGIIISIAASSRFHKPAPDQLDPAPTAARPEFTPPVQYEVKETPVISELQYEAKESPLISEPQYEVKETLVISAPSGLGETGELVVYREEIPKRAEEAPAAEEEGEEFVISRSNWSPKRRASRWNQTERSVAQEKPLVSTRFGHHRSTKPSSEVLAFKRGQNGGLGAGKALGVARSKRNETLESTWRTITDGRPVPLTRHLKKTDTWDVHGRTHDEPPSIEKFETFKERQQATSSPGSESSSAGRLRREPSLGQDDLNRRVEAFIKKFNEEMRLQRQESFQHYLEMINRGTH